MKTSLRLAALCLTIVSSPAWSQSLYLGDLELDTSDRSLMATVLRICNGLDAAQQEPAAAGTENSPARPEQEIPGLISEASKDQFSVPELSVDSLASSDNGSTAAGEGSGTGITSSGSAEPSGTDRPDLSKISLRDCRQAGLVY